MVFEYSSRDISTLITSLVVAPYVSPEGYVCSTDIVCGRKTRIFTGNTRKSSCSTNVPCSPEIPEKYLEGQVVVCRGVSGLKNFGRDERTCSVHTNRTYDSNTRFLVHVFHGHCFDAARGPCVALCAGMINNFGVKTTTIWYQSPKLTKNLFKAPHCDSAFLAISPQVKIYCTYSPFATAFVHPTLSTLRSAAETVCLVHKCTPLPHCFATQKLTEHCTNLLDKILERYCTILWQFDYLR